LTTAHPVAAVAALAAAIPLPIPGSWNDKAVQIAASYFFPVVVVVAVRHSFMKEGGKDVFMAGLFNWIRSPASRRPGLLPAEQDADSRCLSGGWLDAIDGMAQSRSAMRRRRQQH
jgi:hypothetical protein